MARSLRSRVVKSISPSKDKKAGDNDIDEAKTTKAAAAKTTKAAAAKTTKAAAAKKTKATAAKTTKAAAAKTPKAAAAKTAKAPAAKTTKPAAAKTTKAAAAKTTKASAQKESVKKSTASNNKGGRKATPQAASKKRKPKEESSESEEEEKEVVAPEKKPDSSSEEEESDSESDNEEEVKKVAPVPLKKSKAPPKKEASPKKEVKKVAPAPLKKEAVKKVAVKKVAPSPVKKSKTPPKKVASPKNEESSEEDSSGEENSGSDESDDDEVEKVAPAPLKKSEAASKMEESSDDEEEESSDDEVKKVAPAPLKKSNATTKKDESSDEEEDDDSADEDEINDTGFTDDNSNWLKPKQSKMKLMSSDEEEGDDDEFGADASDDDDEEMLDVERQSRLIDAEMKLESEEAETELRRTIAQQTSVFHLPTFEELEEDENRVVPPSELRARIEDVLEVLGDFKSRREPGRSRSEYIERLGQDMAELFGYLQELVDYFLSMFGPNECLEFLEASEKSRPLVVRVNTLKARRKDLAAALMKRGVRLDPLAPWSKVGLKIYESTVPVGATPEYLAGHYMLQSAASMCPVMAMGVQPGDRVLDLSAAPGGKTSYISQLMRNKGVVIANDLKPERQKATVANLHRLGVRNVITCCYDGRKIGSLMRNSFDRILLDAPCSGLGVISRDPSVKVQRTMPDVLRCGHLQKELLVAAIDALNHKSKKGGGYMVYSTCSVAVAENEEVINYLLSKRDVKLVDTGLDFGKPGFTRFEHKRFHPSVALTRRFYPHVHNMDGFYVAKIQKLSDKRKGEEDKKDADKALDKVEDETMKKKVDDAGAMKQQGEKKKYKMPKKKKRGKASADGDDNDGENVARKKSKISTPDVRGQNSQKKKTNAKMTKPRRMKNTGM